MTFGVWGDGNFIYLANCTGGLHSYSVDGSGNLTHIDSDDQGGLAFRVWGDGNFIYLANRTGGLHSYSVAALGVIIGYTDYLVVESDGEVLVAEKLGIGTTSPGSVLDVNGTITSQQIVYPDDGELTISSGAVTATGTYHTVDTESDAASDDLDSIFGATDGQIIYVQAEDSARTVVVKDGTGIKAGGDCTLDNSEDIWSGIYSGALSAWVELTCADNGT